MIFGHVGRYTKDLDLGCICFIIIYFNAVNPWIWKKNSWHGLSMVSYLNHGPDYIRSRSEETMYILRQQITQFLITLSILNWNNVTIIRDQSGTNIYNKVFQTLPVIMTIHYLLNHVICISHQNSMIKLNDLQKGRHHNIHIRTKIFSKAFANAGGCLPNKKHETIRALIHQELQPNAILDFEEAKT